MIINVGARTDIVNYYSEWLMNRLKAGFAYARNPLFPNKVTNYELTPDKVDLILFCSKNYAPILSHMKEISERFRIYCHYTITAYGRDIEPHVPSIDKSIETLISLCGIVGKEKIAWRYDPVLLTDKYTVEHHLKTFEYIASKLTGHVDRCIFSFVEMYKKLETNMPEIILLTESDKNALAEGLGAVAKKYGITIQTCGTNGDFSAYGINQSGCATLDMFGKANNCEFRDLKHKGMRQGCHCIESRDIGAYDTCINACKYCYANNNMEKVKANFKLHDKYSPLIIGNIKPTDTITKGNQSSMLKNNKLEQTSIFDIRKGE